VNVLLSKGRYDGAAYLCGYAVEIALKVRIVKTLRWPGFPANNREFKDLQSFRTHDLEMLLYLSGWESKIKLKFPVEWQDIILWDPESRYQPPGNMSQSRARSRIESAKKSSERYYERFL
jgi:hypothetical protein